MNNSDVQLAQKIFQNKTLLANVVADFLDSNKNETTAKSVTKSREESDAEFEKLFMRKKDKEKVSQNIEKEVSTIFKALVNIAQRDLNFDRKELVRQIEHNEFDPSKIIKNSKGLVSSYDKLKLYNIYENSVLASAAKGIQRGVEEVKADLEKDVGQVSHFTI